MQVTPFCRIWADLCFSSKAVNRNVRMVTPETPVPSHNKQASLIWYQPKAPADSKRELKLRSCKLGDLLISTDMTGLKKDAEFFCVFALSCNFCKFCLPLTR